MKRNCVRSRAKGQADSQKKTRVVAVQLKMTQASLPIHAGRIELSANSISVITRMTTAGQTIPDFKWSINLSIP